MAVAMVTDTETMAMAVMVGTECMAMDITMIIDSVDKDMVGTEDTDHRRTCVETVA